MKRGKTAEPDELPPTIFKIGGDNLVSSITTLLHNIWTQEHIPSSWVESLIVPIFRKGSRSRLRKPPRDKFDPNRHESASLGHTSTSDSCSPIDQSEYQGRDLIGASPRRACTPNLHTYIRIPHPDHEFRSDYRSPVLFTHPYHCWGLTKRRRYRSYV
ncbi:unnamed protein product [Echinostoma caproni]|uniref:Uncharacterized protein n=1 Tax=Echinostoma caproni TaxID=27848 RepID=A0A183A8J5_9TREM|nr:unnamed protein product [Echinostoma caproni]